MTLCLVGAIWFLLKSVALGVVNKCIKHVKGVCTLAYMIDVVTKYYFTHKDKLITN